jgi:predicted transcriptional regulator
MKKSQPSSLEMQVLSVLWAQGPLGARQVLEALPDKKERAYTTVLSVMQVMEKKGLLRHETEGNRHIYAPRVKKSEVLGSFLKGLVSNIFGGSAASAMQHLLQTSPVSEEEIREMRALLDAHTKKS